MKKEHSEWIQIFGPFTFKFLSGSEALTLCINEEGIKSGNWEIEPMLMPPEVYYYDQFKPAQ